MSNKYFVVSVLLSLFIFAIVYVVWFVFGRNNKK